MKSFLNISYIQIPFIFLILGLLWISLGDQLLFENKGLPEDKVVNISLVKGYTFVVLVSLLLYVLIKRHQTKLIRMKNEYKNLFENNPNPMWIYCPADFKILMVNNAAVSQYGYSKEEFTSLSIKDLRPKCQSEKLDGFVKSRKAKYLNAGEWMHQRKDGSTFIVNIYSHDIKQNGTLCRVVTAIDVNDKKEVEEERKALLEDLSEYAFYTSHKLRGPLARMQGLIMLMDLDGQDPKDLSDKIYITSTELDKVIRKMNAALSRSTFKRVHEIREEAKEDEE